MSSRNYRVFSTSSSLSSFLAASVIYSILISFSGVGEFLCKLFLGFSFANYSSNSLFTVSFCFHLAIYLLSEFWIFLILCSLRYFVFYFNMCWNPTRIDIQTMDERGREKKRELNAHVKTMKIASNWHHFCRIQTLKTEPRRKKRSRMKKEEGIESEKKRNSSIIFILFRAV